MPRPHLDYDLRISKVRTWAEVFRKLPGDASERPGSETCRDGHPAAVPRQDGNCGHHVLQPLYQPPLPHKAPALELLPA